MKHKLELFESYYYYPQALKSFVQKTTQTPLVSQSREQLVLDFYMNSSSPIEYKTKWVTGGLIFIENVLHLDHKDKPSFENLTIDRRKMLHDFRQAFQGKSRKKQK